MGDTMGWPWDYFMNYDAPEPCIKCGRRYKLPKPYNECHILVRDYCFDCYCLRITQIEDEREMNERAMEEERKWREESNI